MKTIEERAIEERASEYAHTEWISEFTDVAKESYTKGATEQKAIDDEELLKLKSAWEKEKYINPYDEAIYKQGYHDASEKFREWLKKNWREYVYQDGDGIIHFGHWESDFCKVMEE